MDCSQNVIRNNNVEIFIYIFIYIKNKKSKINGHAVWKTPYRRRCVINLSVFRQIVAYPVNAKHLYNICTMLG